MKQPDSLLKQLFIPVLGGFGLIYLSWQMFQDGVAQGGEMPMSIWIAIGLMLLASVFSFFTAWKRWQLYQMRQMEEQAPEPIPQPQVEKVPFVPTGNMADGADAFARLITGNRDLLPQFKKVTYPGTFESYCCQLEGPMSYLGDTEEMEQLSQLILDRLEQNWKEEKKGTPYFTDQVLISVYLVPALIYSQYDDAREFAEIFRAAWKSRYPKYGFEIGTYEEIVKGFEKKFGCFITTAVCQAQGKADDCYELSQLRRFRDNWLAEQPNGKSLIERYYHIAPSIVNIINLQADAPKVYEKIKEDYLNPCLKAIEQGDNQDCLARYQTMVEQLSLKYGV